MTQLYSAEELKGMETLRQVNGAELKIETASLRVWLEVDDVTITVEKLIDGRWRTVDVYQG